MCGQVINTLGGNLFFMTSPKMVIGISLHIKFKGGDPNKLAEHLEGQLNKLPYIESVDTLGPYDLSRFY